MSMDRMNPVPAPSSSGGQRDPVVTDFEPRQIVVAHESVWQSLSEWARRRNLKLAQMPIGAVPTYCFTPATGD